MAEQNVASVDTQEVGDGAVGGNIFKDEWKDSDAIFIVEKTRFHVHRGLLGLMSPVFEAMFNSDFREKEQREIPLPGKNAGVFLSFLRIAYCREDDDEVTLENVSELLMLADEYQVAKVMKDCKKFLMSTVLDDQTAVRFLLMAQKYGLMYLKTKCCTHLKSTEPNMLKQLAGFQELDGECTRNVLIPQLEKATESEANLKALLKQVFPLLVGSLEFIVHLTTKATAYPLNTCSKHYDVNGKANTTFQSRLQSCVTCKNLFNTIPSLGMSRTYKHTAAGTISTRSYPYGYMVYMEPDIHRLLSKVMDILGE